MSDISLKLIQEPLTEPAGRGRVILQDKSVPVRGGNSELKYVCGSCGDSLIIGLNPISFIQMFGNAEIFIRCNKCKSYNDATPSTIVPFHLDTGLLPRIKSFLSHTTRTYNDLFLQFKELDRNDPRRTVAYHLLQVASAAFLNLVNIKDNLRNNKWWKEHNFGTAVKAGIVPELIENYDTLNTASLMFFFFSLFESGIRRLVRAIDPTACSGGASEFKNIYEWLFARLKREGWTYSGDDPIAFLDLFRTFRNTLHNNGSFYPTKGNDYRIIWQKKEYLFIYGLVPEFYGWEFNLMLLPELITLNYSIMTSDMVVKIPSIP